MRAAVTFIIPMTRKRLRERHRALRSVFAQTDPDWLAVACGAGFVPDLPLEARNFAIKAPEDATMAEQCNLALRHLHLAVELGQVESEWVAFLDEQGTLNSEYVTHALAQRTDAADVVMFRMSDAAGVRPDPMYPSLVPGHVGPSYMVSRSFAQRHDLLFTDAPQAHARFIADASSVGARILLHPLTMYFREGLSPE